MENQDSIFRRTLRLPQDAANFVAAEARRNMTSENAEIVRSIRERMQAATGAGFADTTPAAVTRTGARQGSNSTNGL